MELRQHVLTALNEQGNLPVALLASSLGASPESVLEAVMSDMLNTPEGREAPPIYCCPAADGPHLVSRYRAQA